MSQSADAVYRHHVASARSGIAEGVEDGDAGAHERPGLFRRQFVGNQRHRFGSDDQIIGIAAVEIDPGDLAIDAHGEIPAPARFADETMPSVPAHTDALTFL